MKVLTVSYKSPKAAQEFTRSLVGTGFGVLTDHPIPQTLIKDVFNDWERFFASEEKHQYKFDPKKQAGYFPFKTENAKGSNIKDLKEFYHFYKWYGLPKGMSDRTQELYD